MLLDVLLSRRHQGHQTMAYPDGPAPAMPERFAGRPGIDQDSCATCTAPCVAACPTQALTQTDAGLTLDLGRCLFCRDCERVCPRESIRFGRDYQLAAARREQLVLDGTEPQCPDAYNAPAAKRFGRSLSLRVVSAGGCGACEADTNVLTTLTWDLSRFGIQFVASPRHADGMLLIGPVTENMRSAVQDVYAAIPSPKVVIAVGACAVSGGLYANHAECRSATSPSFPIDLHIPGCPPHPMTILDGLLRFVGKVKGGPLSSALTARPAYDAAGAGRSPGTLDSAL